MKRTLIYGFCSGLIQSVESFRREGVINPVIWVSNASNATIQINHLSYCKFSKSGFYGYPQEAHDFVFARLSTYLDMASRIDVYYQYDIHDYINVFNKTFDYVYHMLTSNRIELVIFTSIPHVGDDYIIYLTAKYLGIQTLVLYQSLFPNKFFYAEDLDNFGYFNQVKSLQPHEHQTIEKKHEKEIFYMKNVKRPKYKLQDFQKHFKARRLGYFMVCYKRFRTYEKMYNRCANTKIDLNEKYVYFPLHLQPEMTTSALGGRYADQVLAIEHLSRRLPEGWYIYLKENPIQTEFMRGRYFWERIKILPNVKFTPIEMNTHLLTKHSQFVATITGTAGWEAITGGKNVLVFGRPWYLTLPGVFQYHDHFNLEELLNYQIDHAELEERFSQLYMKMGTGLVSEDYRPIVPNFTTKENEKLFAAFLRQVLEPAPALV